MSDRGGQREQWKAAKNKAAISLSQQLFAKYVSKNLGYVVTKPVGGLYSPQQVEIVECLFGVGALELPRVQNNKSGHVQTLAERGRRCQQGRL